MSLFGTGRREGFLAVVILVVLAVVQHSPGLLFGQARVAGGSTATTHGGTVDVETATNRTILLPALRDAERIVRSGEVPLWNPAQRFGEPFAVSGAPLWYPPYWLVWVVDGPRGLELLLCLHAAMACAFCYRFLRALPLSRYVAFLGGGMYGLGFHLTMALDRLPEAAAAAWVPLVLELVWRCLFARRRMQKAPLFGIAVACMFLTGGTSTAWTGLCLATAMFVASLRAIDRSDLSIALRSFACGAVLALCFAAPAWLDALQHHSALHPHTIPETPGLSTAGLAGALAPGLFGDSSGVAPRALADVSPVADPIERMLYPGALVLFLALLGVFRPKRTHVELFWTVAFGVGLLASLDGPLAELLAGLTGGPDRPGALLAVVHLCLIVLTSIAFENFFDAPRARRLAAPLGAAFALCCALAIPLFGLWLRDPALVVMSSLTGSTDAGQLDLAVRHAFRVAVVPAAVVAVIAIAFVVWRRLGILRTKSIVAVIALAEVCGLGLLHVARVERPRAPAIAWSQRIPATDGRAVSVGRNGPGVPTHTLAGSASPIVDTSGDDVLVRTARYLKTIDRSSVDSRIRSHVRSLPDPGMLDHPLVALAAVDVAIAAGPFASDTFQPLTATAGTEPGTAAGPFVAVAREPRQRARLVFQHTVAADLDEAVRALRRVTNPTEHLVVERAADEFDCKRPADEPTVEWLTDRPNLQRLEVDLGDGRGFLLIADAFAPGWRAAVDGHPTPVLPAQVAFRAVPLREGRHVVELRYQPWSWTLGRPLVAAGLLLGLWLLLTDWQVHRRRRRRLAMR